MKKKSRIPICAGILQNITEYFNNHYYYMRLAEFHWQAKEGKHQVQGTFKNAHNIHENK